MERDIGLFDRPLLSFARPTPRRMAIVSAAAGLIILQSAVSDGGISFLLAACACTGSCAAELLFSFVRKQRIVNDLSALASALIFTTMLPNTINPAFAFFGAFFGIAVVKGSFGGLGSNWLNPALSGWLFVRFSWPHLYTASLEGSTIEAAGEIGGIAPAGGVLIAAAQKAVDFFNGTILQTFSAEIPAGFAGFLVNTSPGIIADRGVMAAIAASILISASVHRFMLSAVFLIPYLFLVRASGALGGGGVWQGDMFYCLLSGGTLTAAFFLIADTATGPKSLGGKICAVLMAALFSFIFRYLKGETYGVFFAVALVNILCPVIRNLESAYLYNRPIRQAENSGGMIKRFGGSQ
ncbi:MAG: RnfABCDGE type electron transport complex subunit D [Spirochaetaceae bacterium]|nr:RnfABCDGE type electron transport complex subunit D [Spirochaetaceae bacterium]